MSETDTTATSDDVGSKQPIVAINPATVTAKGRITIPHKKREYYDIEPGDVVHISCDFGGEIVTVYDAVVSSRGKVTIPDRKMRIYDVEGGDTAYVEVQLTDHTDGDGDR